MPQIVKIWEPTARQAALINSKADVIFFGGARGGGKTFGEGLLTLDRAAKYGKDLSAIFFRRTNPELEDAIRQFETIFDKVATWKVSDKTFVFWNGAELKMRFLDELKDVKKYQGHNYGLMLFDEVTNFDNFNWIEQMRGSLRSSKIPTQLVLSGNPGGPLHQRLKSEFINPYPEGNVLIPDIFDEDRERWLYKEFIPSKVTDNPYLMKTGYIANLRKTGTPEQVRQWLEGDWNTRQNAAFSDLFNPFIHVVRPFRIPYTWKVSKSYDYGSSKPWACVWIAVSDGSDYIAADGNIRSTIPGDMFVVYELYGCETDRVTRAGSNVGTKESIQSQAAKIRLVESSTFANCNIVQSIADSAIFKKESGAYCVAEDFEREGVYWERCHKYPGSRMQEYILMRERLLASVERDDKPGIFWFSRCANSIRTIPELQMEQDGSDTVATGNNSEDHLYDAHCYFLLSQNVGEIQTGATGNF